MEIPFSSPDDVPEMDPGRVIAAARKLVHLWQTEAEAALIALEVWPELGEAIDELGESFAPPR